MIYHLPKQGLSRFACLTSVCVDMYNLYCWRKCTGNIIFLHRQKPDIYALKTKAISKTLVFAILKHGYQFCGYGRYWGPMVSAQPTLSAMDDIGHQRLSTTDALRNLILRILKNRCITRYRYCFGS